MSNLACYGSRRPWHMGPKGDDLGRRLVQVVNFHQADPGAAIVPAFDRGVGAGHRVATIAASAAIRGRDAGRFDLGLLRAHPVVIQAMRAPLLSYRSQDRISQRIRDTGAG